MRNEQVVEQKHCRFRQDAETSTLEACAPVQAGDDTNCSISKDEAGRSDNGFADPCQDANERIAWNGQERGSLRYAQWNEIPI
jgi:hypothetical protein